MNSLMQRFAPPAAVLGVALYLAGLHRDRSTTEVTSCVRRPSGGARATSGIRHK